MPRLPKYLTLSVAFFSILSTLFLNTPAHADDDGAPASKPFTPPLLVSDYNGGTLFTALGGMSGGDEEQPGTAFVTLVPDDGFTRGNSGYSLRIDYDVSGLGLFSFYWIKLGKELEGRPGVTAPLDLRQFDYISFWVKGTIGDEKIKLEVHQDADDNGVFVFGKDLSSYVYINAFIPSGSINRSWQKVTVPFSAFTRITDWSKSSELVFVFENKAGDTAGTVYLDDIVIGYRPEPVLALDGLKEIAPPVASSFKVNGAASQQCLTFTTANRLEIKAESVGDNPFIECVRFEYSVDQGNTWRTIAADYDVSRGLYKAEWRPDNTRELIRYQIRAVAVDIRGVEKATGTLIDCPVKPMTDDEFLNLIEEKAFEFFADHQDPKTGLFADTSGGGDASIASTGLGLAALCIGTERRWIDPAEARRRASLTLDTFLPKAEGAEPLADGKYGFFYHFLNMVTAKRAGKSEISTVDTAILVAGALTAGEYFGGEIREKADRLYNRVEWGRFLEEEKGPWYHMFSMGWSPERGFLESYWDYYTDEVILISLLAIGSPTHPVDPDVFYAWTRHTGAYDTGKPFVYSWHGALFSYQYAHLWFNLQGRVDKQGIDWFENSREATLANRKFCIDNADRSKTYGPTMWGITSMARPAGYTMHFGVPPTGNGEPEYDGTISPTGPAGSIVFVPYLSISALKYMYVTYPKLWGRYGLRDSLNLDLNWYAPTYYGIGVGMMLVPVENFRSGLIWKYFMKHRAIATALEKAGFTKAVTKKR